MKIYRAHPERSAPGGASANSQDVENIERRVYARAQQRDFRRKGGEGERRSRCIQYACIVKEGRNYPGGGYVGACGLSL